MTPRFGTAALAAALLLIPHDGARCRPAHDAPFASSAPAPRRPVATYSIVARDPRTGDLGVAVQSHWFSVGSIVPWAEAGVGAVATQSFVDPSYGKLGLDLMRAGRSAPDALRGLVAADAGRDVRQVAMIDAQGRVLAHTGARCIAAAGQHVGKDFSVQANLMRGDAVWPAMARAFEAAQGDLADRMMAALQAAEDAGGDIRGRQSAALIVVSGKPTGRPWSDRVFDLRVDDAPQPLDELRRLIQVQRAYNHMNAGDLAVEHGDHERALAEYSAASRLAPDQPEMLYWHAVALVTMKRTEEALPIFRRVFERDASWATLTPRLPASGLLPDDPKLIARIVGMAGAAAVPEAAPRLGAAPPPAAVKAKAAPGSTLIVDATIVDGSGAPARRGSVRLRGDTITDVGALKAAPGDEVVDGGGLALAPGFIDTHSHADDEIFDHPDALAAVSQGITTVVVGQDGGSPFPLAEFYARLAKQPPAVNVAAYAGHGTIRGEVLGEQFRRAATKGEIAAMRRLLDQELRAGALGLSTGLEYDPGIYSEKGEVLALARAAQAQGGRYISHVRSEDRFFWEAIDEIIAVGREARLPVQISHTKLAMRSYWGQADRLLKKLDEARASGVDITGDLYPYLYWQSTLTVLFPKRDFEDRAEADLVLREVAAPDGLLITQFDAEPSYAGRTVAAIAEIRKSDPVTTLIELIRQSLAKERETGESSESVIGTSMSEPDVERLMAWPHMTFCTDGSLAGAHPRGFGSYPRILGHYVRERRVVPLEEAVRKASALAARNMGLAGRGTIQPGMKADLVLFDPATIADRATPSTPHAISAGVARVWVNGALVYAGGRATGARPGAILRRGGR